MAHPQRHQQNIPSHDTKQELLMASPFKFNVDQRDKVYSVQPAQLSQQVTSREKLLLLNLLTHCCSSLNITYMYS